MAAAAISNKVIPLYDSDDRPETVMAVSHLCIALLRVVEGMMEKGVVPLSGTLSYMQPTGRGFVVVCHQLAALPFPRVLRAKAYGAAGGAREGRQRRQRVSRLRANLGSPPWRTGLP